MVRFGFSVRNIQSSTDCFRNVSLHLISVLGKKFEHFASVLFFMLVISPNLMTTFSFLFLFCTIVKKLVKTWAEFGEGEKE